MLSSKLVKLAVLCICAAVPALAQCTFQLSPPSANFSTSTSNDLVVNVSASAPTCAWTSRSNTSWITISFGQTGTGNGTVGFTVTQNTLSAPRSGSLTIAGVNFAVTQAAAPCTYSLTPNSATVPVAGGSGSFNVTTGCSWSAATSTSWLTVTGSGTGNGAVQYTASANTSGASRTGTITVGTQTFTVTQPIVCSYILTPFSYQADPNGATSTFTVTPSGTGCAWTAVSNDPDILTVTSGASGSSNGTVGFKVSPNTTQNGRSGSIAVGNTTFTVYQPAGGQSCTFALSSGSASFASSGGSNSFAVTTTCAWAPTTPVNWISLGSAATVTGNGVVGFLVLPNPSSVARSSTISVGNQIFTINQTGVSCGVTVAQPSISAPAGGLQGGLDVTAPDGCSWTAGTSAAWITLQGSTGSGQGTVAYAIAPNPTGTPRTGSITIANQVIAVTQAAADCSGQVLTPSRAELPAAGGTFTFNVGTPCSYAALANNGFIKIIAGGSGTGTADVTYSISANSSADPRTGTITVGAQTFTVAQSGASCTLSISPGAAGVASQGGSGSFNVTGSASCRWQPVTGEGWIHTSYTSVNGTGKVNYTADPNDQLQSRAGNIFVNDQVFQLTQAPRPAVVVTSAGVVNGASLLHKAVSPGEIVTIFGDGLGPEQGVTYQLTPDRQGLTSTLAGTTVLFDGNPAPLLYVSKTQVSAIVPYEVDQNSATQLQIESGGARSSPVNLEVAGSSPGLFTLDSSGKGPAAILNQDTSVNSPDNPATKGSVVVLFATGEGQTNPAGVDGQLAAAPLPKPLLPVTVQIAGRDAVVLYAGAAPGLPAGVLQVNVRIPAQSPSGLVPVILTVGNAASQSGVTLAVQ